MKILTYDAIVERGEVKLSEPVRLPEHAKVYVVVPGIEEGFKLLGFCDPNRYPISQWRLWKAKMPHYDDRLVALPAAVLSAASAIRRVARSFRTSCS